MARRKSKSKYVPDLARQRARRVARLRKVLRRTPYDRCAHTALVKMGETPPPLAPLPSVLRREAGITLTQIKFARRIRRENS